MALYVISDTHLSFGVSKPMDIFGGKWVGYIDKLQENFQNLSEDDVLVIGGDISWGINLKETLPDFKFLSQFPGKKIILKGNHDLWWESANKMNNFLHENDIFNIEFLHNNFHTYENIAICGTRGWTFEENFKDAHNEKIYKRELLRLEYSLDQAKKAGFDEIYCFLHYPPIHTKYRCHEIIELLEKYEVKKCVYGHLHSNEIKNRICGLVGNVEFILSSGDFIDFQPILLKKD